MFGKQRRDNDGRVKDGVLQKIRSWRLGRQIRKGKLPRGRTVTSEEALQAIGFTQRGYVPEIWGLLSARKFVWLKQLTASQKRTLIERFGLDTLADLGYGHIADHGVIATKKVTTAFRDYLVDSLQDSSTYPLDAFSYHGCGTGTTAEANTQTALVTEVGSRVDGSQTEGTTANIYKTVATLTPGGTYAVTEHGVFSASSSGTMMDRSVFSAINVTSADSIEFTYECTFSAES